AIIWTNTTAIDNQAQISGMVVDDDYVYATTQSYLSTVVYNKLLVIRRSDGVLAEAANLLHRVSSSIPAAYGGRLVIGLGDNLGYEAIRLREDGTTGDWLYKGDSDMTGFVGTAMSGALTTLSTVANEAPPGGVLVTAPNPVGQTSGLF